MAEKITSFPWTKNLPFLHFPKVEVFASNDVVKAVAVAGGMQMGGHFELGNDESTDEKAEELKEEPPTELAEVSAAEVGFLPETEFEEMEIPLGDRAQEPTGPVLASFKKWKVHWPNRKLALIKRGKRGKLSRINFLL